jgi:ferredoxin
MAHHVIRSGYKQFVKRLNRFPQGAPPSKLLYKILSMLFSENEAQLIAMLPLKPFSADRARRAWKKSLRETKNILDGLAERALLLDLEYNGRTFYVLPPPMAGFFEFSLMRIRKDINQKVLSELLFQYLNEEEEFIKDLFTAGKTQLGRIFVQEGVLTEKNRLEVLDYELATHVIRTASHIGIGVCYCRHKMMHVGKACDAPMNDVCMTFNTAAASLTRSGFARSANSTECLELLERAWEANLVQFGENVKNSVNFICNCCGCCCEALIAVRKFGLSQPVHTTNFIPFVPEKDCTGCGKCVDACPVEAAVLVSTNNPHEPKRKKAIIDNRVCLGCGVCSRVCPAECITLTSREERVITPLDTNHRTVLMAIERGKLQNLLFDDQVLWSHRALAVVLGIIFRLPPVKQAMASRQMQSLCLEAMIQRMSNFK